MEHVYGPAFSDTIFMAQLHQRLCSFNPLPRCLQSSSEAKWRVSRPDEMSTLLGYLHGWKPPHDTLLVILHLGFFLLQWGDSIGAIDTASMSRLSRPGV